MSTALDQQADHAIGDEYAKYRADVTRISYNELASAGIDFAARDVDTFYNRAWHGVFSRLWGKGAVGNLERLLTDSTYRQAVDEHRVLHPETRMDVEVLEAVGIADPIEATPEQQQQQREFSARMRKRLNQRELQAVTLCHVYGFKPFEAAEIIGVGAFRLAELMDEIQEEFEPLLEEYEEGEACEGLLPLVNQYALGILDPRSDEYRTASAHIAGCPGCIRHAIKTRGLTAVTNPTGTMLRALTGSLSLGVVGTTDAARRAPSPLRAKKKRAADARVAEKRKRTGLIAGAIAAVIVAGFLLIGQLGSEEDTSVNTAQTSNKEADAKAAKERREARAARERRAERRAERRREARARSRARARARSRAAAARRAARANAVAATPQVQQQAVPQAAPQPQPQAAPKPAPTPKPSTDPSQEFDVP